MKRVKDNRLNPLDKEAADQWEENDKDYYSKYLEDAVLSVWLDDESPYWYWEVGWSDQVLAKGKEIMLHDAKAAAEKAYKGLDKEAHLKPYDHDHAPFDLSDSPYVQDEEGYWYIPGEEEETMEPDEDDIFITTIGQLGDRFQVTQEGDVISVAIEWDEAINDIKAWMEENQFWPNVWYIDDHGGWDLVDMSKQASPENIKKEADGWITLAGDIIVLDKGPEMKSKGVPVVVKSGSHFRYPDPENHDLMLFEWSDYPVVWVDFADEEGIDKWLHGYKKEAAWEKDDIYEDKWINKWGEGELVVWGMSNGSYHWQVKFRRWPSEIVVGIAATKEEAMQAAVTAYKETKASLPKYPSQRAGDYVPDRTPERENVVGDSFENELVEMDWVETGGYKDDQMVTVLHRPGLADMYYGYYGLPDDPKILEKAQDLYRQKVYITVKDNKLVDIRPASKKKAQAVENSMEEDNESGYPPPEPKKDFSKDEADQVLADLSPTKAPDDKEFHMGINVELEHGLKSPETNITDDDPIKTANIAMAHLNEIPNYYTLLDEMEKKGKAMMKKADSVYNQKPEWKRIEGEEYGEDWEAIMGNNMYRLEASYWKDRDRYLWTVIYLPGDYNHIVASGPADDIEDAKQRAYDGFRRFLEEGSDKWGSINTLILMAANNIKTKKSQQGISNEINEEMASKNPNYDPAEAWSKMLWNLSSSIDVLLFIPRSVIVSDVDLDDLIKRLTEVYGELKEIEVKGKELPPPPGNPNAFWNESKKKRLLNIAAGKYAPKDSINDVLDEEIGTLDTDVYIEREFPPKSGLPWDSNTFTGEANLMVYFTTTDDGRIGADFAATHRDLDDEDVAIRGLAAIDKDGNVLVEEGTEGWEDVEDIIEPELRRYAEEYLGSKNE